MMVALWRAEIVGCLVINETALSTRSDELSDGDFWESYTRSIVPFLEMIMIKNGYVLGMLWSMQDSRRFN
jgi:hypothetical protein